MQAKAYASPVAGHINVGKDIKEVLRNDRQAWSVICALVLTISIPASMVSISNFNPENRYNDEASYIFITSISVCTTTSILVIWNSTYAYLKINQLESHKLSEYMELISKKKKDNLFFLLTNSITILANLSFLSIAMLLVSAVYLFYGAIYFWISMPIISFGIISVIYNEYSIQTIYNNIQNKNEVVDVNRQPKTLEILDENAYFENQLPITPTSRMFGRNFSMTPNTIQFMQRLGNFSKKNNENEIEEQTSFS